MKNTGDLTEGPILRRLVLFFLPIAAGTLFQQLYNAVDAFVVSKFVGTDALAAVGGSPAILSNLVIGFCTALTAGAAVIIAQQYGAGQKEQVRLSVRTSYVFFALFGILVGLLMVLLSPALLTLLKTPAETYDDALLYQRIYFSAAAVMMIFNMGAGILRAVGNARFPFICLFAGCGVNIVLDIVFVAALGWGVAGVAWATVIAQTVSAAMVTLKLAVTDECYGLRGEKAAFHWGTLRRMMRIGIPSGLQSSMYGISNMILQIGVNSLGTVVVASWAMSGKIDGVYWAISGAFSTAITTFIGQNYGAGNEKRVKEGAKKGFLLFFCLTAVVSLGILLSGQFLLSVLTDDPTVIDTTWEIMLYFVPIYIIWSIIETYCGVLRGIGDVVIPSMITALGICAVRILWILTVFRSRPILASLCICYPVSWFITATAILIYYRKKIGKVFGNH